MTKRRPACEVQCSTHKPKFAHLAERRSRHAWLAASATGLPTERRLVLAASMRASDSGVRDRVMGPSENVGGILTYTGAVILVIVGMNYEQRLPFHGFSLRRLYSLLRVLTACTTTGNTAPATPLKTAAIRAGRLRNCRGARLGRVVCRLRGRLADSWNTLIIPVLFRARDWRLAMSGQLASKKRPERLVAARRY